MHNNPKTSKKVIFPELSYKIMGCLFDVYKTVGGGHRESYYQNAIKKAFIDQKINFQEQLYLPLKYKNTHVGKLFFDFLIEDKIILEIKVGQYFKKSNLEQVIDYLKTSNLKLGIIANFTREGVKSYRVLNTN